MASLAEQFLTFEEQQRVTEAVRKAEKKTSGEIVPMIVSASDRYPLAVISGAVFLSFPLSLLTTRLIGSAIWVGPNNMWLFLACFFTLYVPMYYLVDNLDWLKRKFLIQYRVEEEVENAAIQSFFTKELYRTKDQNGILLYISVFERRVWILGDSGINEKIPQQRWQKIVEMVVTGIKNGQSCEVICGAITEIGDILEEHFPYQKDDTDELHNLIIE